MTLIDVPVLSIPCPWGGEGGQNYDLSDDTDFLLDAAGEIAGFVFRAPKAGEIDQIHFRTGTVTTGDDLDVRLETVDAANGDPTGTLADTNSNATQAVGNGDDDTWFAVSLTASATVTADTPYAIALTAPGGYCGNSTRRISPTTGLSKATISARGRLMWW